MKLTGIHHVSILVSDLERTVAWYLQALGAQEMKRPSKFVTPVRWFELGEQQIHLISDDEPDVVFPAIWRCTDDVKAAREVLADLGEGSAGDGAIAGTVEPAAGSGDGNRRRSRKSHEAMSNFSGATRTIRSVGAIARILTLGCALLTGSAVSANDAREERAKASAKAVEESTKARAKRIEERAKGRPKWIEEREKSRAKEIEERGKAEAKHIEARGKAEAKYTEERGKYSLRHSRRARRHQR